MTGLCYTLIFASTRSQPLWLGLQAAALNCGSLGLSVLACRAVIRRWSLSLGGCRMWRAHLRLAVVFSAIWAWLLYLVTGIAESGSISRFAVVAFLDGPAQ